VSISNTNFIKTFTTSINIISSISKLEILPPNDQVLVNTLQVYQVKYASLGEPSCALIDYKINGIAYYLAAIGTDVSTCSKYFPTIKNYIGPYAKSSGIWTFGINMNKIGFATININVANYFSASNFLSTTLNVVATLSKCSDPTLEIKNGANLFYAPVNFKRSDMISITSITNISCLITLDNKKEWLIYKINEATGLVTEKLTFPSNPTIYYAELVLPSRALDYGTYKFVYKLSMLDTNNLVFENEAFTYVKIVQTGLIISAINLNQLSQGGTIEINRGTNQIIEFNPALNSYDLDNTLIMTSLKYKFYCQIIDSGIQRGYPQANLNENVDLKTYKLNPSTKININQTCLESTGSFFKLILFTTSANEILSL
jgi:hypothetical protein